ncbi:MAG: hypothetical protein HY673_22080 [Chloroflexi bacterium]|nr:hypothetical protein [Chloroflexota bacterium]
MMPVYEYRCTVCGRKTSLFLRSFREVAEPSCCGAGMVRCLSSFAYHKSEATRLEEAGDPDRPGADYYKDPRNIGRWTEKKFSEMGMEMPAEIKEKIAASREGELPAEIKDL